MRAIELFILGLLFYSCSQSSEVDEGLNDTEVLKYKVTEQFSFNDSIFELKSKIYEIEVNRKDSLLDWKYSEGNHRIQYILDSDYSIKKILNWGEFISTIKCKEKGDSVLIVGKSTQKEQDYNQGIKYLENPALLKSQNTKSQKKNGMLIFTVIGHYSSKGLDLYMPEFRKLIPIKETEKIGVLEMKFEYSIDSKNKKIQKVLSTISAPVSDSSIYKWQTTMELK